MVSSRSISLCPLAIRSRVGNARRSLCLLGGQRLATLMIGPWMPSVIQQRFRQIEIVSVGIAEPSDGVAM